MIIDITIACYLSYLRKKNIFGFCIFKEWRGRVDKPFSIVHGLNLSYLPDLGSWQFGPMPTLWSSLTRKIPVFEIFIFYGLYVNVSVCPYIIFIIRSKIISLVSELKYIIEAISIFLHFWSLCLLYKNHDPPLWQMKSKKMIVLALGQSIMYVPMRTVIKCMGNVGAMSK